MHGMSSASAALGRPVKVLLLLTSLHGGGAERVAAHLMKRLDPEMFDIRMGLLRAAGPYVDQVDMDRVIVAPDGERHFNYDGSNKAQFTARKIVGSAARAPLAFRRMIKEIRPDVVMSFLKGTNLLVWAALMGLGRDRPKWIAREGNNVLKVITEEAPNALVARISLALTRGAYARADAVLANSTDMAIGLARDLRLDPSNFRTIHNPIDLEAIERAVAVPPADLPARPFILTAGRLEYQKAHEVLLRAYAASGAARDRDLVILGQGSRLAELESLVRSLGIAETVRFPGFSEPFGWMARADLFVLPSRWEGFPTVAAEALACGAPLLLTDCSFGPRDIVEPGVSGELVSVDDVPALAAAMSALLANPARRAALAAAGRERVKRFAIEPMTDRYAALFEEMAPARARLTSGASPVPPWHVAQSMVANSV